MSIMDQTVEVRVELKKECKDCKQSKPYSEFNKNNSGFEKLRCRECQAKIRKEYDDRVRKIEKDWYAMWIG